MKLPAILPSTRLAIQVGASAIAAIVLVDMVELERPYWVVMTAVLVMVGSFGETLAKSWDRTFGTLLGLVAGGIIYWLATLADIPPVALLVPAVPAIVFFLFVSYRLMIVWLTIVLVFLFRIGGADDALLLARLVDTAIGAAVAAATSLLVLPIPTRKPVAENVDAYIASLVTMVHDALLAVTSGQWSAAIDSQANILRRYEADLERLVAALKVETALIGGSGRVARGALSLLPLLRGHVDAIVQASQMAVQGGLGKEVAEELMGIDRQIAVNLERLRDRLVGGAVQDIPRLDAYAHRIEAKLAPHLAGGAGERHEVMTVLNVLLALRRLNRGLRHAMEATG